MARRVPQRLEQRVREPQRQQVLHRLFAQVVVDAEDAVLVEHAAHGFVDLHARGVVRADGLLENDAAMFAGQACRGETQRRRPVELRRRGHEIQDAIVAGERGAQRVRALRGAITRLERCVGDARQQVRQRVFLEKFRQYVFAQRGFDDLAELLVGHGMPRGTDEGERRRHQLLATQVIQRRPDHALRQIAGGAKQNELLY